MHTDGPVTRLLMNVVPSKHRGLRVFLMVLLGAGIMCAAALAAPAPAAKSSDTPAKQASGATYVGTETCASCHEEVTKGFANNPHTKMALMHGGNGVTCENCHGAGSEHVAGGGDVTKIFNPAKAAPKDVDAKCLGCHAGAHPDFLRSPHAKANVSCISCHDIHGSKDEALLKAPQPTLCFSCHADVKPQFSMPFHHKVNEGAVSCSDCHDPHGTFGANNVRSTVDQNAICTKCHTEKRGPFVYEHAAVKGEGCMSCHTPHGSQNPRLLNMASIDVLCAQCHSMVATNTIHNFTWSQSSDVSPCVNCHTMVHGSNLDPAFLR